MERSRLNKIAADAQKKEKAKREASGQAVAPKAKPAKKVVEEKAPKAKAAPKASSSKPEKKPYALTDYGLSKKRFAELCLCPYSLLICLSVAL